MLKNTIDPCVELHNKANTILGKVSFGLEIISLGVTVMMRQTPTGLNPTWAIIYQAKGALIGSMYNVTQMTVVGDPFISDEELNKALADGCASMRTVRAQQMNGTYK